MFPVQLAKPANHDDTVLKTDYTLETKHLQVFRFMVGPGHCPIISKYDPSLSKAVGPGDPSF